MKLTFQQDDDLQANLRPPAEPRASTRALTPTFARAPEGAPRPARSDRRSGFSRAREQLSQAVGGVLSLGAFGSLRTQGVLPTPTPASAPHGQRLREVLERDRALLAAQPAHNEPAPRSDWVKRRAGQADAPKETSASSPAEEARASLPSSPAQEPRVSLPGSPAQEPRVSLPGSPAQEPGAATLETYAAQTPEQDEWIASEARAIEVLAPRADAIAQAIADAISQDDVEDDVDDDVEDDDDDEDTREMVLIQLEPLVASSAATVVMPTPMKIALCQEPIRTRTMAKLLAAQGHRARALSIYNHLLLDAKADETLRSEAEALRAAAD